MARLHLPLRLGRLAFSENIAVYAVPNNGGWYDFGFFLGITVLGGGSFFGSKSRRRE